MSIGTASYHSLNVTVLNVDDEYQQIYKDQSPMGSGSRESSAGKSAFNKHASFSARSQRVPVLYIHLFATILEDVLFDLHVLGECTKAMNNYKIQYEMEKMHSEKFGVKPLSTYDELLDVDPDNLECDYYKLCKYIADRNLCTSVITNTYKDLVLRFKYDALTNYRKNQVERADVSLFLIDEEAKNRETRRDLRKQLRQQRNRIKSSVYESDVIVDQLMTRLEDEWIIRNTKERYIDKWESSRTEQHMMRIQETEAKACNNIDKLQSKLEEERRVHAELGNIINVTLLDALRQIDKCMNKYENDVENMDYKITVMRVNYEKILEKRLEMEQRFTEHDAELEKWTKFKKERKEIQEHKEKMESSAIIVQAWWRGLLVRLKLGPFHEKVNKKKRPKKK